MMARNFIFTFLVVLMGVPGPVGAPMVPETNNDPFSSSFPTVPLKKAQEEAPNQTKSKFAQGVQTLWEEAGKVYNFTSSWAKTSHGKLVINAGIGLLASGANYWTGSMDGNAFASTSINYGLKVSASLFFYYLFRV